jgi:hypothetical protein
MADNSEGDDVRTGWFSNRRRSSLRSKSISALCIPAHIGQRAMWACQASPGW